MPAGVARLESGRVWFRLAICAAQLAPYTPSGDDETSETASGAAGPAAHHRTPPSTNPKHDAALTGTKRSLHQRPRRELVRPFRRLAAPFLYRLDLRMPWARNHSGIAASLYRIEECLDAMTKAEASVRSRIDTLASRLADGPRRCRPEGHAAHQGRCAGPSVRPCLRHAGATGPGGPPRSVRSTRSARSAFLATRP